VYVAAVGEIQLEFTTVWAKTFYLYLVDSQDQNISVCGEITTILWSCTSSGQTEVQGGTECSSHAGINSATRGTIIFLPPSLAY
jgi:hypothetical protein